MTSTKKVDTIDLKGKSYATVPARIKEFRQDCPNGDIKTTPTIQSDGTVLFEAYILKDKSDVNSASATGHSIGKLAGDKAFEKLETIAIGRALAILGYMASGEIASSKEMEEFQKYKKENNPINVKASIVANLNRLGEYTKSKEKITEAINRLTGVSIVNDTTKETYKEVADKLTLLVTKQFNENN